MKTKLAFLLFLATLDTACAQDEQASRFAVEASAIFWSPTALHLKKTNSITQIKYPDGTYISSGVLSGYGTSLAPNLNLSYYFSRNLGLTVGLHLVHMDNELTVYETDSTFSSYENLADIPNITLGLAGRVFPAESLSLFYEAGLDFIPGYMLEMQFASESADPPDLDATGLALGVYARTGARIRIARVLLVKTALIYSFVPLGLEYTNSENNVKINTDSNLGGIGFEVGLSFSFQDKIGQ